MGSSRRIADDSDEDEDFSLPTRSRRAKSQPMDDDEDDGEFEVDEVDEEEDEDESEENQDQGAESNGKSHQLDEEEDEEEEMPVGRRKTSINYNEDEYYNEKLSGDELLSEPEEKKVRKKTVKLHYKKGKRSGSDDESFHEDDDDDDDDPEHELSETDLEAERRRVERNFIVKDESDDDDDDDDDEIISRSRKRARANSRNSSRKPRSRGRGRPRKSRRLAGESEELEEEPSRELTIADELRELEDSPVRTPPHRKFNFRERKEVNYQLPPPISNDKQLENEIADSYVSTTPKRGRKANTGPLRRLFPTVGPFGGGDVTSIFGQNVPGLTAVGGGDSDSSDDEILPVNGTNRRNSISQSGTAGAFGRIEPKKKNSLADNDPLGIDMDIDFSAVGGLDNYIDQLKEMVALPLLYPEVYQRFGITPPRGVLFHGPPGTGKTLMARALAASCSSESQKITFFMRKGADILSKWVGEAERQLRLLFEEAKKQQPSIIFFDEIDGLAPVRSSKQEQIHASIVSTMLALMDGMDNRGQVIVIGATNRPDSVDPALRRPGRFDREFYFPLPDAPAREKILQIQTKKWNPPLDPLFISKLAVLTKGYGGADLRALCTESALNSIQRKYPQIYQSTEKLKIRPEKINVIAKDFMKALEKIVPSSARSVSSISSPLPDHIEPLLKPKLHEITSKLDKLIPRTKKISPLEESLYVDFTENDLDGGFKRQELLKSLNNSRVFKPRVLLSGPLGSGQVYLGRALLHYLEGYHVQSMDLSNLFTDSTRSIESAIIQMFIELKRHTPSVIYIPNIDIWYHTIPESAKSTLCGLLRAVEPNEKILVLCIAESEHHELADDLKALFGFTNNFRLANTFEKELYESFFTPLWTAFRLKPFEFGDLESRPKRKLRKLKVISKTGSQNNTTDKKLQLKQQVKNDMRLKNTLKLKLSGLMELFKNRYKRFRKPTIDDSLLVHLFEPSLAQPELELYRKDGDMILEVGTGRHFHNMDLDIIEERLWNGFYSEPKQFLKDVEYIYKDALVTGDRDRILKASEMFANAQVGVEEVATAEFAAECRKMHLRELERQKLFLLEKKAAEVNGGGLEVGAELVDGKDDKDIEMGDVETGKTVEKPEVEADENEDKKESAELEKQQSEPKEEPKQESEPKPESESESETESETDLTLPNLELQKTLQFDSNLLESIQNTLVNNAAFKYTIENLEEINSQLMEIIWEHRLEWDRNGTLQLMSQKIEEYHDFYKSNM